MYNTAPIFIFFSLLTPSRIQAVAPTDYGAEVSALVVLAPPQIVTRTTAFGGWGISSGFAPRFAKYGNHAASV